jgi:hypothetical protein
MFLVRDVTVWPGRAPRTARMLIAFARPDLHPPRPDRSRPPGGRSPEVEAADISRALTHCAVFTQKR